MFETNGQKLSEIVEEIFYSKSPIKNKENLFIYRNKNNKEVLVNKLIFVEDMGTQVNSIIIKVKEVAKLRNEEKQKDPDYNFKFPTNLDASTIVLMEILMTYYERINNKLSEIKELDSVKKDIENAMFKLQKILEKDYNRFFGLTFLKLREDSSKTKDVFNILKNYGVKKLTTKDFEFLFNKFFNQENKETRDVGVAWMVYEHIADEKVINFLLKNDYAGDGDIALLLDGRTSFIYENMFYGGILSILGKDAPRLQGKKKKLHIKNFCQNNVFVELYKSGLIDTKELSEILSHEEILSVIYKKDDSKTEIEKNEKIENSYFSGDEIVELFKTNEFKYSLKNDISEILWYRYIQGLISLDNLKEIENIKLPKGNQYFNLSKVIEYYTSLNDHKILKEYETEFLEKEPIKKYFSFDKIIDCIQSENPNVLNFINTRIREIYTEEGIDFEYKVIKQIEDNDELDNCLLFKKLVDKDIVSINSLINSNLPKDDYINLYKALEKDDREKKIKKEKSQKSKDLLYSLSKNGILDLIDIMDIVEECSDEIFNDDDEELNYIFNMIKNKELSTQVLLDYYEGQSKKEVTEELFEKAEQGIFNNEIMKELVDLFDYEVIQSLYNNGKIDYSDLKQILDLDKAKEIDQRYDIVGKIKQLIDCGGIKGVQPIFIEREKIGNKKGKNKQNEKNNLKVQNYDESIKLDLLIYINNLNKDKNDPIENPTVVQLESPVFDGFLLYTYPQYGIGILEELNLDNNNQSATYVVRLKETLEAVRLPKENDEQKDIIFDSRNTLIGKAQSKKAFRLDNPDVVRRIYHSKNWGRNLIKAFNDMATNNSQYFGKILKNGKKDDQKTSDMKALLQLLSENYEKNVEKKREQCDEN